MKIFALLLLLVSYRAGAMGYSCFLDGIRGDGATFCEAHWSAVVRGGFGDVGGDIHGINCVRTAQVDCRFCTAGSGRLCRSCGPMPPNTTNAQQARESDAQIRKEKSPLNPRVCNEGDESYSAPPRKKRRRTAKSSYCSADFTRQARREYDEGKIAGYACFDSAISPSKTLDN